MKKNKLAMIATSLLLTSVVHAGLFSKSLPRDQFPARGVCSVIGTDSFSDLPQQLAASSNVVVHSIVADEAALAKLTDRITTAGLNGYVTVEKLPLNPLPYRDNVLNQIIVEDITRATAAGLTSNELMRVLAPGGKLCVREGRNWIYTVKSRPPEMDDWTHSYHGPDGGWESHDKLVSFPIGLIWEEGVPFNPTTGMNFVHALSSTRGMALNEGRCFVMTTAEHENLLRTYDELYASKVNLPMYLTARDAWNGQLLWRRKLGDLYYGGLHALNRSPLAAVGGKVYTVSDNQKLIVLDGATGNLLATYDTQFIPGHILVDRNTVVAATWKDGSQVGGRLGIDRRLEDFNIAEGTVEAFDAVSGKKLWSVPKLATSLRSADGNVYIINRNGPDLHEEWKLEARILKNETNTVARPEQRLMAFEIRTGKPLWSIGPKEMELGPMEHVFVDCAGSGAVAVSHNNGRAGESAYRALNGSRLFHLTNILSYASIMDGRIVVAGKVFDPKTGNQVGGTNVSYNVSDCTPQFRVNGISLHNRFSQYIENGKWLSYRGNRGACVWASVPGNGKLYSPQTWCGCAAGAVPGFTCTGPIQHIPTTNEMERVCNVEKGPAFGMAPRRDTGDSDWPMLRHGADRSASTPATVPTNLVVRWKQTVAAPIPSGNVAMGWKESLIDPISAPVVADGVLVVSDVHRHQVIALDASTGKELWRKTVAGRVDTSPTLYKGICLFGSHDGVVQALEARTGRLVWKMNIAPDNRRMGAFGQIESVWPVIGSVLISNGKAYATAGRTTESDGGISLRAFDPFTGAVSWSRVLDHGDCVNDVLFDDHGSIGLLQLRIDPRDGKVSTDSHHAYSRLSQADKDKTPRPDGMWIEPGREGLKSGNWRTLGRRRGGDFHFGPLVGILLAWDHSLVARSFERWFEVERRESDTQFARDWSYERPADTQVYCIVLASNAMVVGGGLYPKESQTRRGFVQVVLRNKGHRMPELRFDSPLVYEGLVVAGAKVYATLIDGSIVCLE